MLRLSPFQRLFFDAHPAGQALVARATATTTVRSEGPNLVFAVNRRWLALWPRLLGLAKSLQCSVVERNHVAITGQGDVETFLASVNAEGALAHGPTDASHTVFAVLWGRTWGKSINGDVCCLGLDERAVAQRVKVDGERLSWQTHYVKLPAGAKDLTNEEWAGIWREHSVWTKLYSKSIAIFGAPERIRSAHATIQSLAKARRVPVTSCHNQVMEAGGAPSVESKTSAPAQARVATVTASPSSLSLASAPPSPSPARSPSPRPSSPPSLSPLLSSSPSLPVLSASSLSSPPSPSLLDDS